ncbi:hypothetical protein A2482_00735 [Candidatus Falkowbacteria bacterium RIFOXYC2_FULL_48_21]|uniref:Glycosyltransferase RgtA/B/C/D-like domain-containing protein n=1 Tax=Candidatus Falkowbacteria bacterium RIFOXYC2_FULL_48_21 TaxID=1798005 RepID=A0A1F5T6F9_9BACT|nr:MAG: hypothetical protein A2482_00735 [Candidatus Falkowbacteria bacterium RIFOXYC2_FULL_48_21]
MIELLSKTNRISQRGLIWSFLVIWALGVAIFWPGEEPAKVNTLLVVGIVFVLAYLIIAYAAKSKIITSKIYWMVAFLVMMTLVAIVLQFVLTVSDIGHRDIDGFDPIRYDYDAKAAVESGLDFTAAKGSYNFLGVIYYIAGIYWMFGISTFYVSLFNLLFVLVGFLAVTKILIDQTGEVRPWQKMAWGMLIPSVLYYAALPSKDILAMSLIALILCLVSILLRKRSLKLFLFLAISCTGLIMIRASALIIVAIVSTFIIFSVKKNKRLVLYALILLVVVSLLAVQCAPVITKLLGGTPFSVSKLFSLQPKIKMAEELSATGSLNLLFMPRTYVQVALFMPIRALFFLISPFPNVWIWGGLAKIRFDVLSLWLILFFAPALIAATISKNIRRLKVYNFIVIPFWLMIFTIATALFIIHERYRLMLTPFWLATVLIAYRYGKPNRYLMPSLSFILAGLITYVILKLVV